MAMLVDGAGERITPTYGFDEDGRPVGPDGEALHYFNGRWYDDDWRRPAR